jgi:transposase
MYLLHTMTPRDELTEIQWTYIESLIPRQKVRADGKGRPRRSNREIVNGILWVLRTGARWKDMPEKFPPYQTCHRRLQEWVRSGRLRAILESLAKDLEDRGKFNLEECFIDATFVVAKKGAPVSEKPSGARGLSSWQWQTALVFLSPYTLRLLRHMKSPLFERLSKAVSFDLDPSDSSVIERMTLMRLIANFNRMVSK